MWGNPHGSGCFRTAERSIPTCVGQPTHAFLTVQADEVYPHVCGATEATHLDEAMWQGLSPRVWGNPAGGHLLPVRRGSIPTCVGQPNNSSHCARYCKVYPHVCGATWAPCAVGFLVIGLSPRVWGNRTYSG